MKKIIISFVLSFIFISSSFACSCIVPPSPEDAKNMFSNVFIWKVESINKWLVDNYKNKVKFDIYSIIKWEYKEEIEIITNSSSAACWYNFEEAKEYIVYAYQNEDNNNLEVSLCSRTSLLENATEDTEYFKDIISWEKESIDNNITKEEEIKKYDQKDIFLISLLTLLIITFAWFIFTSRKKD